MKKKLRMDRTKFNIGAYCLNSNAREESDIKAVADCGIDFVVKLSYDYTKDASAWKNMLDLFEKYGVGVIASDMIPYLFGGKGTMAENPRYSMQEYTDWAARFEDHPAIWGIEVSDEPCAKDFEYHGKVMEHVEKLFPNQFAFTNLLPSYANAPTWCTDTYEEYLEAYDKYFSEQTDFLCIDYYVYGGDKEYISDIKFCENLRLASEIARRKNRHFWMVLQVNTIYFDDYLILRENHLRYQAFTAMAFGVESVMWACYGDEETKTWGEQNVLDKMGNKTAQYEKLKKVNSEIRVVADEYMKYRCVDTNFINFANHDEDKEIKKAPISSLTTEVFSDVTVTGDCPLVVGTMNSRTEGDDSQALMMCAGDDFKDKNTKSYTVTFRTEKQNVTAIGKDGWIEISRNADGSYALPIQSNDGVLIIAK